RLLQPLDLFRTGPAVPASIVAEQGWVRPANPERGPKLREPRFPSPRDQGSKHFRGCCSPEKGQNQANNCNHGSPVMRIKLTLRLSPLIQSWNSKESPGQKSGLRLVQSVVHGIINT